MKSALLKNEKFRVIAFFAILTVVLTWPVLAHFFSSVPTFGSDTMQVIGSAGGQANLISSEGIVKGMTDLAKRSEINVLTIYAFFQLIFGRVAGYNILFYLSFILSGFGAYLLADYFFKNKKAALLAGVIFAFSPFHMHNSLSTNVGTMHQEWLPFFALYLFKFFEKFELKHFGAAAVFLLLIGLTEHQLVAFTMIFILFFVVYKLLSEPKKFIDLKLWLYVLVSAAVFSILFFFIFHSLFSIASSDNNFLDAGLKAAVKYSNDSLSIFVTPSFHSFWPGAFAKLKDQFERSSSSTFSVFAGYSVLLLSFLAVAGISALRKKKLPARGIWFWLAVALGFYILSWGPYLHYRGVIDPPIKMPYYLIYQYLPFYKNIRTVGRLFVWSMLGFSLLAGWGMAFLQTSLQKRSKKENEKNKNDGSENMADGSLSFSWASDKKTTILYSVAGLLIILEFLAIPLKTDSLLHSSFYEKLGQDSGTYNLLEIPGSTDYDFASRDLVWRSIHKKNSLNGYDFARVNKEGYTFQRGTPIIRTLLYDIPDGSSDKSDKDIMSSSYYDISSEILNYYNIKYIILDHEGLRGNPDKGDLDQYYTARAYVTSVVSCANEYEDAFLYACEVAPTLQSGDMFFAMDYTNPHWVGKMSTKNGTQRLAESGAGVKLVNMSSIEKTGKISFSIKVPKPLEIRVLMNGENVFQKYLTQIDAKTDLTTGDVKVKAGQNDVTFEIRGADGKEILSDKKTDTPFIFNVDIN